jgi:hypothetical protein
MDVKVILHIGNNAYLITVQMALGFQVEYFYTWAPEEDR